MKLADWLPNNLSRWNRWLPGGTFLVVLIFINLYEFTKPTRTLAWVFW